MVLMTWLLINTSTFHMHTVGAGLLNPEETEPADDQLHDTSYPGRLILVSVKQVTQRDPD